MQAFHRRLRNFMPHRPHVQPPFRRHPQQPGRRHIIRYAALCFQSQPVARMQRKFQHKAPRVGARGQRAIGLLQPGQNAADEIIQPGQLQGVVILGRRWKAWRGASSGGAVGSDQIWNSSCCAPRSIIGPVRSRRWRI